jgi:hypothetical protein
MKKSDFIKSIKENNLDLTGKDIEKANQELEKFKINIEQLQDMGVFEENFDASKDYESYTDFYVDIIDDFMNRKYGVTYFNTISDKTSDNSEPETEPKDGGQLSIDFPKNEPFDFSVKEKTKPISQMSGTELNQFLQSGVDSDINFIIKSIKDGLEKLKTNPELKNSPDNPLKQPYLTLQNLMKGNMKENFVDSKIFTIIAEAESPKISKKEILEFLNRK